jgi:hypothetical protein
MNPSDNESSFAWFGRTVRSAYKKLRKPAVFLMVGIVILGNIWPKLLPVGPERQRDVQLAVLGFALVIILQLLFEIHAWTDQSVSKPQRFPGGMQDARESIKDCLRKVLKHEDEIQIQWIGMTMYNVWANNLEDVLKQLESEIGNRNVTFKVAMSDGKWLDANKINSRWTSQQAQEYEDRILEYGERRGWVFEVSRYAHMPMLHGGLINNKYLFLGISRWEEAVPKDQSKPRPKDQLKAGDRLYELYRLEDGEEASDKIKVFRDWFNFSFGPKPEWYAMNHPKGIATPVHGTPGDSPRDDGHK